MKPVLLCELTLTLAFGLSLCISSEADAEVVGVWLFNEGSGRSASDSSGNGLTGTFGGNPQWQPEGEAMFGSALRFANGDYIDFGPPTPAAFLVQQDISFMAWCKPRQIVSHWQVIFSMQRGSSGGEAYAMTYGYNDDQLRAIVNTAGGNAEPVDPTPFVLNEWVHAAATYDGDKVVLYRNGEPVAENSAAVSGALNHGDRQGRFAINGNYNSLNGGLGEYAECSLDEVLIFDEVLSQEQIRKIMGLGFLGWQSGPGVSEDPKPEDKATDVPYDVTLSWTAGEFAGTHDVYVGTSFEDVNAAGRANPTNVLVSQGQSDTTYDFADPLAFGQTCYWRIDEVNAPPDSTIYKGRVWSFTVEPLAYPISGVAAAASSSVKDMGPEKTVDGSGLTGDRHSTLDTTMWLSAGGAMMKLPAWIRYEFPQSCRLHQMRVWNSNLNMESFIGYGAKDVVIEYSLDGAEWTKLRDQQFEQAQGNDTYEGQLIPLDGVHAKFVRLTILSNWGGYFQQAGLSEVRFFHIPVRARAPEPASAATDVAVDDVLSWRPGREAVAHEVYLSTDKQAAIDGTATAQVVTESRFAPQGMEYGQAYYWKVNETNKDATPSVWEGDVWSFSTATYAVIDDFEDYTNDSPSRLFQTWIDGWGFSPDDFFPQGNAGNGTGASVGHDIWSPDSPHVGKTIVETGIVRTGSRQSMPLYYDNKSVATSEAQYTFPAQDWTAHGIKSLSLWFYGDADNTGQLYVKVNSTKVPYNGDATDIKKRQWQPWNIDLSAAGVSVSSVTKLTIGVEGAGAAGMLYIDDIRLYPKAPEYTTPTEPDNANLAVRYALDGNVNDSSGRGFTGTAQGNPTYAAGVEGQAIQLDGVNAHVVVAGVGITGAAPRTISGWARADRLDIAAWTNVFGFTGPSGNGGHFDIEAVGDTSTTTLGYYGLHRYGWERNILPIDLEWHHLAATYDGAMATWYGDGLLSGSVAVAPAGFNPPGPVHIGKRQDNTNFFPGLVDEVRIYDRALSDGEIAWLAGRRTPLPKPF